MFLFRHLLKTSSGWFFRVKPVTLEAPQHRSFSWVHLKTMAMHRAAHNCQPPGPRGRQGAAAPCQCRPAPSKALPRGRAQGERWLLTRFRNNQSFIQWITGKYVNKDTEEDMHTYSILFLGDILPVCWVLGPSPLNPHREKSWEALGWVRAVTYIKRKN